MSGRTLVLASTSRYRRALLARLGLPFDVEGSDVDEDAYKTRGLPPDSLARELADAKAAAVAARRSDCVIIGSDQVAELDGDVLDKPGDHARALTQLLRLQGRTHALHTAVTIVDGARVTTDLVTVRLTMRAMDEAALDRYLRADAPYDCCGSYRIESRGIALFESIEAADATAIEGLPMLTVVRRLREAGLQIP